MGDGGRGQTLILSIIKQLTSPLAELLHGQPIGGVVALVHLSQQVDVPVGEASSKAVDSALPMNQLTVVAVLLDQPGHPLAGVAADLHEVADDNAFVPPVQRPVAKPGQHALNPSIAAVLVAGDLQGNPLAAIEKGLKFVNCGQFFSIHDGFHPFIMDGKGGYVRLISYWKRLGVVRY